MTQLILIWRSWQRWRNMKKGIWLFNYWNWLVVCFIITLDILVLLHPILPWLVVHFISVTIILSVKNDYFISLLQSHSWQISQCMGCIWKDDGDGDWWSWRKGEGKLDLGEPIVQKPVEKMFFLSLWITCLFAKSWIWDWVLVTTCSKTCRRTLEMLGEFLISLWGS